jgi:molecular chaperone HtpG
MRLKESKRLYPLLIEADGAGAALALVNACGQILDDNKTPFFPAYTDHGSSHIEAVLEASERLIPDDIWNGEVLTPNDAIVLVCAILLHDLAMHLREPGFLLLVTGEGPNHPLPWFDKAQRNRGADLPWPELWQDFRKEASRFSQSQLDRILGPNYGSPPQIVLGDFEPDASGWTTNDRLLIGEFLRRHHARLAHEISAFGFPGLDAEYFPVLAQTLPALADAIGATARSHNEDLRVIADYLSAKTGGDFRPDGVVQLYLMAVLRVADYFQLQPSRATPLLLHLKDPQSPISVDEWRKHQAITTISWAHRDPDAVNIQVSPDQTLRTHLQLGELLADLQREIDRTAAVLSETYGGSELADLRLALQRVRTNLNEPDLLRRLPFVPRQARLESAEDLFRLVISDLYGNNPAVAGRELLQNAVDAVRELDRWRADQPTSPAVKTRDLPADVLIEARDTDGKYGYLRVVDKGIGMKPATVIESYLQAGATFRELPDDDVRADPAAALRWMKAGHFGVGAFAAFLLGPEIQVNTRHPAEERGVSFTARIDEEQVQLNWECDVPVGTEITVRFSKKRLRQKGSNNPQGGNFRDLLRRIANFYGLEKPTVAFRFVDRNGKSTNTRSRDLTPSSEIPVPGEDLSLAWRSVDAPRFDAVFWEVPLKADGPKVSRLAHNGLFIEQEVTKFGRAYRWGSRPSKKLITPPTVAVFDARQRLRVSLNRYELVERSLPFEAELLESIGADVVAHALVAGPTQFPLGVEWGLRPVVSQHGWFPLTPQLLNEYGDHDLLVLWIAEPNGPTAEQFCPNGADHGGWEQVCCRVALAPKSIGGRNRFLPETIKTTINSFQSMFSIDPVATVLAERQKSGLGVRLLSHRTSDATVDEVVVSLGRKLIAAGTDKDLGVTLFRRYDDHSRNPKDPVSRSWETLVGDQMARSPEARDEEGKKIASASEDMAFRIDSWERRLGVDR